MTQGTVHRGSDALWLASPLVFEVVLSAEELSRRHSHCGYAVGRMDMEQIICMLGFVIRSTPSLSAGHLELKSLQITGGLNDGF